MKPAINRRQFLGGTAAALALEADSAHAEAPCHPSSAPTERPKKSVMFTMLPENLSLEARFRLARDIGFEGVEAPPVADESEAKVMRAAAEKAGLPIHSIIYGGWEAPLSSSDPAVVARGLDSARHALQCARWMGAEDILLVPAVVDARTRYVDAWERSRKNVHALIPAAEKLGVMICIEEVWNHFLLSPLEFAHYIDSFRHPLVQVYFDVGNVVIFGWPEDWIRTLGRRIRKVHLKDFKRATYQFVPLLEGDVDWPEVRRAFAEVGYHGYLNTELPGGDEAYLRDVSARVDKILGTGD
ncbi:MAG TPA: sugar phosphate isomerase/epimerase family protein [Chthonomonadaceae bacterium]|nr:sugar phosphate isomerase/epimerase family protein [Chthonomonadaceae bacterium]